MGKLRMTDVEEMLKRRRVAGISYDLSRMEALMKAMDHPERRIRVVHIAGTNGKGSVAAFTGRILEYAGLVTGSFQSPVFGPVHHHVLIGDQPLDEGVFLKAVEDYEALVQSAESHCDFGMISEFEWLTGLAFYVFDTVCPVDVAIVEAGMGGRLDSTNVMPAPLVTVITNVGYDHQAFLGDTLEAIATEKAGIIKAGVPCVTSAAEPALSFMRGRGNETGSCIITVGEPEVPLSLTMKGAHQQVNAAVSMKAAAIALEAFGMSMADSVMQAAIRDLQVPGRFEEVRYEPAVIVDTAHNVEAIRTTIANIRTLYASKEVSVLFAAMQDKPVSAMLKAFQEAGLKPVVTDFSHPRAMKQEAYPKPYERAADAKSWVKAHLKEAASEDVLLITGSHQFIGDMRAFVTKC
ncbi:bifunctional folylpolyglutamate synthase/dihydrofolate synthase [Salisediminibacterium selenitireducens]|uniref:tetrahydrofolate synthase n=1 Tax=Bacillus selenitireducens (strain ATCC 700615 / DSM 15326 / MLS10) TaxID=439292 RepID=D6XT11_BACIE|nr:Mur ligase family protein [Salisediminibacterium selenitireducens]ADH98947.1 FolC bifunctional protein [[Bacillus] selenitireducens MLS10]